MINLLVLLSGCGLFDGGAIEETCEDLPGGCEGSGDGGTDSGSPITIAVDSIEPVYGLTAGGEAVVLRGGPFASDVEVRFGGEQAELRTWLEDEVRVLTPAVSQAGWVDVTVETSQGEGGLSAGYRYFRDGTDQTGMLGYVEHIHPTGALASLGDSGFGQVGFITPKADATWLDSIADGADSCRRDWAPDLGWELIDPGADQLDLSEADGGTLSLAWDSAELLFNGEDGDGSLSADQAPPGGTFGIDGFTASDLPPFAIAQVLELPEAFTVNSPDLDSSALSLGADELDFTWEGSGGDTMYLALTLVDGGTGSQIQKVTCLVEDDGAFSVPATAFDAWASGMTLYLKLGRAIETVGVLPLNNADTRLVGGYAVVGAATTE